MLVSTLAAFNEEFYLKLTAASEVEVNLGVEHAKWGCEWSSVSTHIHLGKAIDFKTDYTCRRTKT